MNYSHYLSIAFSFLLMILAYFALIAVAFHLFQVVIFIIQSIVRRKTVFRPLVLSYVNNAIELFFYILCFCVVAFTTLPHLPIFLFWNNGILLGVLLLMISFMMSISNTYNIVSRNTKGLGIICFIGIDLIIIFSYSFPSIFSTQSAYWAALLAAAGAFCAVALSLTTYRQAVSSFQTLDARHDDLHRQYTKFQHIRSVLPDTTEWLSTGEILTNLKLTYDQALQALSARNMIQAETLILRGEAEIEGLDRIIQDRIQLSLNDELLAKILQAQQECVQLRQMQLLPIEINGLADLEMSLSHLQEKINKITFDVANLATQLQPFEDVFGRLEKLRTSIRIRNNIRTSLIKFRDEVNNTKAVLECAQVLGLTLGNIVCGERQLYTPA